MIKAVDIMHLEDRKALQMLQIKSLHLHDM